MPSGIKQSLSEGYERFVEPSLEGCWGWNGCIPKNPGYGQFTSRMKKYRSHIASWLIFKGEIPKGMCVCHTCDNRICSNPKHLFLATDYENNQDMVKKGRSPILYKDGESNPNKKLTEDQVKQIIEQLNSGISQRSIAADFKVSQTNISLINARKAWGYLFLKKA